jgi:hypothetical protein
VSIADSYPELIERWRFETDEVLPAAEFSRRAARSEITDGSGLFYPARDGRFNLDFPILPSAPQTLPLDSTHVYWIKH